MPTSAANRNLLFGILALQMDFITHDALIKAMHAWVLNNGKPLGHILVEQGTLTGDLRDCVEVMIEKHLQVHGNDVAKSLAALNSAGSVRENLKRINDPQWWPTIDNISGALFAREEFFGSESDAPMSSGARFRILRPHAKGGLGEVFVARDEEVHRDVALKEIQERHADNPASRARFLLEAEITGGLEHPGIVPVYGLGTYADGRPFYAMRFIRGDSLKDAIADFHNGERSRVSGRVEGDGEENRTVAFRKLLGRFIDVCNAIGYAHSRGVLHRDLKPGNIMLGKYGETLVVDWGLAKTTTKSEPEALAKEAAEPPLRPSSGSGVAETVAGTAIGTPPFMSPEQAAGRLDLLGRASDVYSLGATLYCLLTGRAPFDDKDKEIVLGKVQKGEFRHPRNVKPDVPAPLEAICLKAMALERGQRYASPRALADDIEHWLADEPVTAWPEPVTIKAGRWARKHKPLVSGAAAALLVGVIALSAGYVWYESQQAEVARKQLLAEAETARQQSLAAEKVRQGLDQARATRDELHKTLKKPGGVHELLNQPTRWQAQIKSARADWQRANDHAEATADSQWVNQLTTLDQELTRDQADYDLAVRLEKIRLDRATPVEGEFGFGRALEEYPAAFAEVGLAQTPVRQKEVALLIQQSAINDQLVAALDDWANVAVRAKNTVLTSHLLEVARLADPDPWRDKVRDLDLWKNKAALVKLAEEAQADRGFLVRLSPQMLALVGDLLPKGQAEGTWLRTAQSLHPADFWINFGLAFSLAEKKDSLEAAGFYRVALAIRPNSTVVYNNLGLALRDQKDLPAAMGALKKALAIDPSHALSWHSLGIALRDQKDLPTAMGALKKALAIDPKFATAWNNLGIALREQKDLPAAIDAHKKALAIDPNLAQAWDGLGFTLAEQKDLPAAIDAYKKALAINPKLAQAWNRLGFVLAEQKDLPAAIDAFKKALAIDPQYAAAWTNLGIALTIQKDWPAAIGAHKKALAIDPKFAPAWTNFGIALAEQKDLRAAIDAFKNALAIDPQYAAAWTNLGSALADQQDLPAAMGAFKKALAIDPKNARIWSNFGHYLQVQKDLPAAIDAYKKALAIDPQFAQAWTNLGVALQQQKDLPAAIDAYKKALAIDPKLAKVWSGLGVALHTQKDLPAAIDAYKKALAIDPENASAWTNLGMALGEQKDLPTAIEAYKSALAINPQSAAAWNNLGIALHNRRDLPTAINAYKKALAIDSKNAGAWSNLGRALYDQNDLPAAISAFKKGLAIDPQFAQAWNNLGTALREQKDLPAAIDAYKQALAINPQYTQAWNHLGISLYEQKDLPAAIEAFKKALAIDPKHLLARKFLGGLQRALALDRRLPGVLRGDDATVADHGQRISNLSKR